MPYTFKLKRQLSSVQNSTLATLFISNHSLILLKGGREISVKDETKLMLKIYKRSNKADNPDYE